MPKAIAAFIGLLPLLGCASLIVHDTDSGPKKAGKVTSRVLLGITTLGISEICVDEAKINEKISRAAIEVEEAMHACATAREPDELRAACMLHEHRIRQYQDAVAEREAFQQGMLQFSQSMNQIQQQQQQQQQALREQEYQRRMLMMQQMQLNRPVHCSSRPMGGTVYTSCY